MLTFKVSVSPQVKVRYVKVKHMRYFDKTIFDTESWSDEFCCVTAQSSYSGFTELQLQERHLLMEELLLHCWEQQRHLKPQE